ncbi:PAS domain S-box protein [Geotalea sp. SG265]|uniref:PAS domain S-box protein n=1 Tax=Geotalea sp. SG265 TaxID=2922867 RepID=UPI001FAFEB55|nr:PAS domain S-box protein [Geotalea sp. SG265]
MSDQDRKSTEQNELGKKYSDALNHINILIHSQLDIDSIMNKVVVEVARTVGAESAVIFLEEDHGWVARFTYGMPEEMLNKRLAAEELSYSALAVQQGKAVVINDPLHDDRVNSELIHRYGINAILDVALSISKKMVGNMSIHYHRPERKFTDMEVDFANKAASTITLALKNALLLKDYALTEKALKANEQRVLQTLDRLMILVGVSSRVLSETTIEGTLNRTVEGALAVTDARIAASGHGYKMGRITLGAIAHDAKISPCPTDVSFTVDHGGVYMELLEKAGTIRLTQEELVNHPLWWGLPKGHAPLNGLLGARLEGTGREANGLVLVSHKRNGEFDEEDEVMLTQLCQLASLAIRHIEARNAVEKHAAELETLSKRLRESEERFREFFVNAPIGMAIMDVHGRFHAVNRAYCNIFGYEEMEVLHPDFNFMRITHPADVERNVSELNRVLSGEVNSLFIEKRNIRKDGTVVWVRVSAAACLDEEERPARVIAIVEDIQDRKEAEEALKISEANYRTIFNSANDGLFVQCAQSGAILDVNQKVLELYKYSYEEVLRLNVEDLSVVSAGYTQERAMEVGRRATAGEPQLEEWLALAKDGTRFWVEVSLKKVVLGGKDRLLAVVRDISERKRVLDELERSNRELEQFAYIASHDLQEPLRMVAGYVKLLERKYKGRLDAKAETYINFAVDGAARMQKLIEGLLAYSRISRGISFAPIDAGKPFAAAVANLDAVIRESGARIGSGPLPVLEGDETQLMQLFQNLLSNGIKYRKRDVSPEIHVSARRDNDEWLFAVQDNGIGIERKYFEQIFQIFRRLHGQDEYQGTGIGLASCKKIVERHGGRIWVESEPGKGSTFCFTIPALRS